jgi:hypothetical protein
MKESKYNNIKFFLESSKLPNGLSTTTSNNVIRDSKKFVLINNKLFYKQSRSKTIKKALPRSIGVPPIQWIKGIHFEIITENVEELLHVVKNEEEMLTLCKESQIRTNHGGRDLMRSDLIKYYFVGKERVIDRTRVCDICEKNKPFVPDEVAYTPIQSSYPLERV